jgi:TPR repeat protein
MASKKRSHPSRKIAGKTRGKRKTGRERAKLRRRSKTQKETKPVKKRSAGSILEAVRGEIRRMIRNGTKRRKNSKKRGRIFTKPKYLTKPEREHLPKKTALDALVMSLEFAPINEKEQNIFFLSKAAFSGDLEAQHELGIRLALGLGISKELNRGLEWLKKAGLAGQSDAQFALGLIYDEGVLVGRNLKIATSWYQKAAESGNAEARYNLASCHHLQGNHEAAFHIWNQIAKTGDHRSRNNVGTYLALGIATTKGIFAAAEIFKQAEKNGYIIATYNLGICYEFGEGVVQSNDNALRLIESAAQSGYHQAQYHLFDCYLAGTITGTKNHTIALMWLNKAREEKRQNDVFAKTYALDLRSTGSLNENFRDRWAEHMAELGNIDAQCYIGRCYAYGTKGIGTDFSQSIKWLTKAAMSDHPIAQYVLGCLHHKGLGTKRDINRAAEWHRLAAINGVKQSLLITANNYQRGIGVPKDEIQAYAYYCAAGKPYKSAFLESKRYEWEDFAAGEKRYQALQYEMATKRKT